MKAIEAPLFLNLEKAREWVNRQLLDETFYLIRSGGDPDDNQRPDNIYEFFSAEEMLSYGGYHGFRIIEAWS